MKFSDLREIAQTPWRKVERGSLVGFGVGFGLLILILLLDDDGFVVVLDHANLAFHEAGHFFFGILGQTMNLYGGTLGQFVFPGIAMAIFWSRRETIPFAVSWIWLFENLRYVSTYMADSRALVLPRVGGGMHDWRTIFLRWNALQYDTKIATVTLTICWLGMLAGGVWLLWRWYKGNRSEFMTGADLPEDQ